MFFLTFFFKIIIFSYNPSLLCIFNCICMLVLCVFLGELIHQIFKGTWLNYYHNCNSFKNFYEKLQSVTLCIAWDFPKFWKLQIYIAIHILPLIKGGISSSFKNSVELYQRTGFDYIQETSYFQLQWHWDFFWWTQNTK